MITGDESNPALIEHHDLKTTVAGIAGNVLEWYDFSVYGYFSDIIGKVFFPPTNNPNGNLLKSFAVFGIAFLVRPIGGAIFGHMGDNVGRKSALENSILLMALPTFCLGLLPSYDSVGLVSTALLILCRVVQGFSVGGQLMSSIVFSLEGTDESSWGMRTAFVLFATMLGAVVGSLISYILREVLSEEDLISYGWRIPFFLGILGLVPGLYLKFRGKELKSQQVNRQPQLEKKNTFTVAFGPENRRALFAAILVPALSSGGYYVAFIWLAIFMEVNANVPHAFGINTAVGICGIALCFLGGWLADRFGPKGRVPLMLISSLVLGISAPFFIHIISEGNPLLCFSLQLTMGIFLGIFGGSMQPWLISLFPREVRLTSAAVGYNLSVSLIGGFSPALATLLVEKYGTYAPGFIISGLTVFSWIGIWIGASVKKNGEQVELVNNKLSGII